MDSLSTKKTSECGRKTVRFLMDILDNIAQRLKPHSYKAKILLEVARDGPTLKKALEICKASGCIPTAYKVLHEEDPRLILLHCSSENFREFVLRITEGGFTRFKALDSIHM
jgi:hypothetical protein